MTDEQKQLRDEAARQQGDNHACPIVRSMYPSKSRGEMAREFAQLFSLGHDFAFDRAQVLVEALDTIIAQNSDMSDGDIRDSWHRQARAALAEWRGPSK